jgi:hypothetical protein
MNTMADISESIKDIISIDIEKVEGKSRKIKDKDVANALEIDPQILATAKNRGKILFEQISNFCAKKRISINTFLYGQTVESLSKNTDRFFAIKYCLAH